MNQTSPVFPPGRAVIFNGYGLPFEHVVRNVPCIRPGEILVRTLYTTLCGSDIHTYCGRRLEPPHVVLGHEMVGEILWIHPLHPGIDINGDAICAGDRVTWCIFSVPAGIKPPGPGMPQKSDQLFKYGHASAHGDDVFNGGLADYCVLHSNTALVKVPGELPLKIAATISCAHATVSGALRVAGSIHEKKILVFGAGLLGLSCVAMCREAGASWIGLVDTDMHRLEWGKKFSTDKDYLLEETDTDPLGNWPVVDFSFDMTGSPEAMKMGLGRLDIGGIAVWIGAVFPNDPVQVDAQMVVRKLLQIRGLHNYNYEDFRNAALFITANYKSYPFDDLIEAEYTMDNIEDAFAFAAEKKPVRVGIKISETAQ